MENNHKYIDLLATADEKSLRQSVFVFLNLYT